MAMMAKGVIPIKDKFLQNNYLFAMLFREGFVFGRTLRRRICQYKPWYLIDADVYAVDIAPGYETSGCLRFRDPRNTQNDVLFLDDERDRRLPWILHGAFGIKPQQVYMYLRLPEAQDIPGKFPNIDPVVPSAGDRTGYISGVQSPYEMPTDFAEVVIPPKVHICAEYYNQEASGSKFNHRPALNLLFCVYWFQPLHPDLQPNLISAIATRKVPAAFFMAGVGDVPIEYGSGLSREWGSIDGSLNKALPTLTIDEAAALGGDGRVVRSRF